MSEITVVAKPLPNMPWEERPEGCRDVMWRYSRNPVIPWDLLPTSNSIFNSAVVPFESAFAGVFRCDNRAREMRIHAGRSEDALNWEIDGEPIAFASGDPEILPDYAYDPRVCLLEDRYMVTWCTGYHGPAIGMAWTRDFREFHQLENATLPYNRNGVLFPRRVDGKYVMLSRPSDTGHTAFGDIFLSRSPDLHYWGDHRHVMGPRMDWESTKIGAGPVPIETSEGWLLFHHGVLTSCNGYVYCFGAALLDLDEPWKVVRRAKPYILSPKMPYECCGDVPNVVFPCAALVDGATGRIAVYYGAADTTTCLCFGRVDEIVEWIGENALT